MKGKADLHLIWIMKQNIPEKHKAIQTFALFLSLLRDPAVGSCELILGWFSSSFLVIYLQLFKESNFLEVN